MIGVGPILKFKTKHGEGRKVNSSCDNSQQRRNGIKYFLQIEASS